MTELTGFYEERGADEKVLLVTRQDINEALVKLGARLHEAKPGTHVRIDLIVWADGDAPAL